jgi:hypothetical protein
VDPSMSVKRNVTVPVGRTVMPDLRTTATINRPHGRGIR